jgi:hypothetical protein
MKEKGLGSRIQDILRSLVSPLGKVLRYASLLVGERQRAYGFEVVNLAPSHLSDALFGRIKSALALVEEHDPKFFARMQRDLRRIIIAPEGGSEGSYWASLRASVIDARHLMRDPVESVAMTLVHEATHARLQRAGIPDLPSLRSRIEAVCLRAEIALGSKLPGTDELVAEAKRAHETEWWDAASRGIRRDRHLRALGVPEWLVRLRARLLGD